MGNKSRFYANIEAMHDEVTGSCILISVSFPNGEKMRFIVDCGLYQEREYEKLNKELNINVDNIDFVLVTHNHVDHIGRLPLLVKKGYQNLIYMSEITGKIISPALNDSYKVLKERASNENRPLIYSTSDVHNVINQKKGIKFYETIQIGKNVKVTFLKNGHLIGAAMILVQISYKDNNSVMQYDDINLLFTGDYKKENVFFEVEDIPEWIRKLPLIIIQESTYGDIEAKDINYKFDENIIEASKKGKEIFIPAFSQGRFQEIMLFLKRMQEKELIEKNIPIFLDGNLAFQYTNIFLKKDLGLREECKEFVPQNSIFVNDTFRREVIKNTEPKIIISTSGMASYGPARLYLPNIVSRKNALIHFTGYNAEGTLGRRVLECKDGEEVIIGGMQIKKRANVQNTREFSGHAKSDEMIQFLKSFDNIKLILINHGNLDTKLRFMDKVKKEVKSKNVAILDRNYFYRINAYGLLKQIQTKK
ncbi:MAG: MBL fold metallo-hydrolase [Candidatus Scatovivens sp.]